MQDYTPNNICNIGLVGHSGSGKTVLCDTILFNANAVRSIGVIDKGTTVSDYRPEEISSIDLPTGSPYVFYYEKNKLIKSEYLI